MAEKRVSVRMEAVGDGQFVASFEGMSTKATAAIQRIVAAESDTVRQSQRTQAAVAAEARAFDALRASLDPAYAATRQYEQAVEGANRAMAVGVATQADVDRAISQARAQYHAATEATDGFVRSANRFDGRGLAMQLSQVAQSASATGDPVRSLAIQLPDIGLAFGTVGIAAGVAAGALLPLIMNMVGAGDEAKTLEDQISDLEAAMSALESAERAASRSMIDLRDQYGAGAAAAQELLDFQRQLEEVRAERQIGLSLRAVSRDLGDFGNLTPQETRFALERIARYRDEIAEMQRIIFDAPAGMSEAEYEDLKRREEDMAEFLRVMTTQRAALEELETAFGVSTEAAIEIGVAVQALDQAEGVKTQAEAARELARVIDEATKGFETTDDTAEQLIDTLMEAAEAGLRFSAIDFAASLRDARREAEAIENAMASITARTDTARDYYGAIYGGEAYMTGQRNRAIREAADDGILDLIAAAEGTDPSVRAGARGYNETLDYGRWTGGPVNLVSMTLDEVLALGDSMRTPENRALYGDGKGSSALGRYQIVGQTLRGLIDELGLTGSEIFDPAMQDRLATQLVRGRMGQGPEGFRNEWQGLQNVPDTYIQAALGAQSISGTDAVMAREAERAADKAEKEAMNEIIAQGNNEWQRRLGLMDPVIEAQRVFNETQRDLNEQLRAGEISADQYGAAMAEAEQRLDATTAAVQRTAGELQRMNENARDAFGTILDGLREGAKAGDILGSVLDRVADRMLDMAATGFADAFFPAGGAGGGGGKSGGGIWGAVGSFFSNLMSFDGGGYTGDGPRSGGLDGMGGFLAMVHPQERIVDETRPGSAAASAGVRVEAVPNPYFDLRVTEISAAGDARMQRAQRRNHAAQMRSFEMRGTS